MSINRDKPWVIERGTRMPSGKYWWVVRNTITGETRARNKKWTADSEVERMNDRWVADHP
jgi:hypothetical protein